MKKILFLIHDLGQGGAEKVLVNLVNNMDKNKYNITVMSLFDVGENKKFLKDDITYKYCFKKMPRGNSHFMKLLSPKQLHHWLIKDKYDIEVAYLEGPSTRIISGCQDLHTKLVSWVHIEQKTKYRVKSSYRSYNELLDCYSKFSKIITVSKGVQTDFMSLVKTKVPVEVLYNTNESEKIKVLSREMTDIKRSENSKNLVCVGKLLGNKGFHRVINIVKKLIDEQYQINLYILGSGPDKAKLENMIKGYNLNDHVSLLGYQLNPYKYIAKCDLFVCASYAEGFSTAATEALILGIPVCTVEVSGMKEMLGENNEFGVVVENKDENLYEAIKNLLDSPEKFEFYKKRAEERGKIFSTKNTVKAVENMLDKL